MSDTDTPSAEALAVALDSRMSTCWVHAPGDTPRSLGYKPDQLSRDAAAALRSLASERDALRAALDAERERCALVVEAQDEDYLRSATAVRAALKRAAKAIRTTPPQQEPTA